MMYAIELFSSID